MYSLSARLLLSVSALLLVFFGATIFLLDTVFRDTAEQAIEDRLYVQLIVLLAEAEAVGDERTLTIAQSLPEARFETPGSGLYGVIHDAGGTPIWRSPSSVGRDLPSVRIQPSGGTAFERIQMNQEALFSLSLGVEWEFDDSAIIPFVFTAAEDLTPYAAQVARFRRQLFGWFAALIIMLISGQALLVRWVLQPLHQVEEEIVAVEQGQRARLGNDYPRELQGVTSNLNGLLNAERERLARYRDTLGNLAHSLKTPLAVIRTAVDAHTARAPTSGQAAAPGQAEVASAVREQVQRMQDIVAYQLQRAAAWGATSLGQAPVPVLPVVEQLVRSLEKVYAERALEYTVEVQEGACFYGEQGDLMEMLGNLMDNASKWAKGHVHIQAQRLAGERSRRDGLRMQVSDDGTGIAEHDVSRLTERGVRADERVAGHGIGLNIVREIIGLYDGQLLIGRAASGGAQIAIEFPAR